MNVIGKPKHTNENCQVCGLLIHDEDRAIYVSHVKNANKRRGWVHDDCAKKGAPK